ncbi:MAG TPA: hypothetical protein VK302_15105 [Terriglobales bacterium]|nr:hypothetical protein [Terriglobales bacterium]
MAANPSPRPRAETATFRVDAATVTGDIGTAVAGNTIDWDNESGSQVSIEVQAVNAKYPFAVNTFNIPAGLSHTSTVLANTPTNNYPYGRNGSAGIGHIVVGQVMPKRGK